MCIHVKWSQASLLGVLFANWNNISVQTAHKKCIQIGCPEWFGHVSPCAVLLGKKNAMSHFFGDINSPITACSHYCQQLLYQRPLGFHSLSDVSGKSETSWMQFISTLSVVFSGLNAYADSLDRNVMYGNKVLYFFVSLETLGSNTKQKSVFFFNAPDLISQRREWVTACLHLSLWPVLA